MRRATTLIAVGLLVAALLPGAGAAADADGPPAAASYIVVLDAGDPGAVAAEHAVRHEVAVGHVYTTALRGYVARMSEQAAARIARDSRVAYVEADRAVSIVHHQCGHDGGPPGSEPPPCDPGDVYGTVIDADSGDALDSATVTIEETGESDTTDGNGDYLIADVVAGTYTVTATADGYTSDSKEVPVDGDTEVNFTLKPDDSGGDDDDGTADGAQVTPWGVSRTGADIAQDAGHTGAGAHVYVIDSGIDADHVDLAPNLRDGYAVVECHKPGGTCLTGWDDDHGHGTHVAGTAGAADNPDDGQVVGVAPAVTLHAVKVLDRRGRGWRSDVIAGIDWVASHNHDQARVANMSLGGSGSKTGTCTTDGFEGSDSYHAAICNATRTGVVFAVAAGNSGADAEGTVPAAYDDTVITTSATQCDLGGDHGQTCVDGTDDWPSWSNWGDTAADWTGNDSAPVAIAAPGVDVLSAWNDGGTHVGSGTSMAAPHVAGAAALVLAEFGLADPSQAADMTAFTNVRAWLLANAEVTDGSEGDDSFDNTSDNPHDEDFLDLRALTLTGGE